MLHPGSEDRIVQLFARMGTCLSADDQVDWIRVMWCWLPRDSFLAMGLAKSIWKFFPRVWVGRVPAVPVKVKVVPEQEGW